MSDLISRQDAIDALNGLCDRECEYSKEQRYVMCGACHLGSAFDVIEQLPSAEPERMKGRWILEWENEDTRMMRCSECRMVFNVGTGREGYYCPNCGARMNEK